VTGSLAKTEVDQDQNDRAETMASGAHIFQKSQCKEWCQGSQEPVALRR
jgi:hypothetical protein